MILESRRKIDISLDRDSEICKIQISSYFIIGNKKSKGHWSLMNPKLQIYHLIIVFLQLPVRVWRPWIWIGLFYGKSKLCGTVGSSIWWLCKWGAGNIWSVSEQWGGQMVTPNWSCGIASTRIWWTGSWTFKCSVGAFPSGNTTDVDFLHEKGRFDSWRSWVLNMRIKCGKFWNCSNLDWWWTKLKLTCSKSPLANSYCWSWLKLPPMRWGMNGLGSVLQSFNINILTSGLKFVWAWILIQM